MMSLLWTLLFAGLSFAYIPEYSLIAGHTAENHGRGAFQIEQEVTLRKEGEPLTVKETWIVNGESQLRVALEGKGSLKGLVQGAMVYDGAQKFFLDGNSQKLMSQRLGDGWLEPLFHFRSGKYLRNRLAHLRIAPQDSLHDRPPMSSDSEPKYDSPPYLRLSRVGGTVAWAIGAPPSSASPNPPALWIEQDGFLVRKVHTPDQTVLKADDYEKFEDGLWFPRVRTYNFGKATIEVRTLSVKSLGRLKADDSRFKTNSLKDGVKLPEPDVLREFYSRFR